MKIIIFGATGSLGQHVVEQALQQGHQVSAFARHPKTLIETHPNLTAIAGDVLDLDSVEHAIRDHDAVIITLGAGMKGGVRASGTQNVITAMQQQGIKRLICLSTLGAGDSHKYLNFLWKYIMFGMLLKNALSDHEQQEAMVRSSGLDWTLVRPAAFTDGPATSTYQHGNTFDSPLKLKISRRDVAHFMLQALTSKAYLYINSLRYLINRQEIKQAQ